MTKTLEEFDKQIKNDTLEAARIKSIEILAQMTLAQARKERGLKQKDIANALQIAQANVSQLESRPDTLLSTLDQYVRALGGELELRAKFPDGQQFQITQFNKVNTNSIR